MVKGDVVKINYIECSKCEDLTGFKFNKLTVIKFIYFKKIDANTNRAYFSCRCDCGNSHIASGASLKSGTVKQCPECAKLSRISKKIKINKYEDCENYIIGYCTNDNSKFLIDKEDYDKIKDYCWYHDKCGGYIVASKRKNKPNTKLHNVVMNDKNIDHIITTNKWDNRKSNLRKCTHQENMRNCKLQKDNISGFTGVYWSKKDKSWYSQITVDRKCIHLGYTKTKEDAIIQRLKAEKEHYKEFAPQRHLFKEYGII